MAAIEPLQRRWDKRAALSRFHPAVEIGEEGLMFGAGTVLAPMRRDATGAPVLDVEARAAHILALLSVSQGRSLPAGLIAHVAAAAAHWRRGEKALANLRLVFAGLPRLAGPADAHRLFLAETVLDAGMSPRDLMQELGLDPAPLASLFHPDELRAPRGEGIESGRWERGGASGAGGGPRQPGAERLIQPVLFDERRHAKTPEEMGDELQHLEGTAPIDEEAARSHTIPLAAPMFLPGLAARPGATPRPRTAPSGSEIVSGRRRTGLPVPVAAGADDQTDARDKSGDDNHGAELCPLPAPDRKGGQFDIFAVAYAEYVRREIVNPERDPPLPNDMGYSLPNPATGRTVVFDDCKDTTGWLQEYKGHYARLLKSSFFRDVILKREFLAQAKRQIEANDARNARTGRDDLIEWRFDERETADFAWDIFGEAGYLSKIKIYYTPYKENISELYPDWKK